MAWMQKLVETYDRCKGREPDGAKPLMPIAHTVQNAHIEVTLDGAGNFLGARVLDGEPTLMPSTEDSAARSGTDPAPHPLCDKIKYCAADYPAFGGVAGSAHARYVAQLAAWAEGTFCHAKVQAVLAYVRRGDVVADLVRVGVLHAENGALLQEWLSCEDVPAIFAQLPAMNENERKMRDQGDALVRWRVEIPGEVNATTWDDNSLSAAWIGHYANLPSKRGLCMVSGTDTVLAVKQPARLRHSGDGSKLISSNDTKGYTYLGRFENAGQAACIGFEATQKAHNALRWLIDRQATRNGEQVVVAWAVGGDAVPGIFEDSRSLLDWVTTEAMIDSCDQADVAQSEAWQLRRAIKGYRNRLDPGADVVVMALDTAGSKGKGRLAVTYYRELKGSEFLDRIEGWHRRCSWWQSLGWADGADGRKAPRRFFGAPAPRDIAEAAHGRHLDRDGKLLRATVDRLLPCIVDAAPIPNDLVQSAVRRTCGRSGLERGKNRGEWEFEKCLGVACGLYRGAHEREEYRMALEEDRRTRDYLYGRLLAVAERIETIALVMAKENRDTSAAKLMQRFADRPYTTWRVIETQLVPYKSRLRANRPGFLVNMEKLLDGIMAVFNPDEFRTDHKLSGEFLLGYHCQRQAFRPDDATDHTETDDQGN